MYALFSVHSQYATKAIIKEFVTKATTTIIIVGDGKALPYKNENMGEDNCKNG